MDFEELPRESTPAIYAAGLAAARTLLDQILDGVGHFTEESIRFLNKWHSWMSAVLTAWERGGELPPALANWNPSAGNELAAPTLKAGAVPSQSTVPQTAVEEPAIRLNLAEDAELLREFHSESLELLQAIEQGVAFFLERDPALAEYPSGWTDHPSSNWWKYGFPACIVGRIFPCHFDTDGSMVYDKKYHNQIFLKPIDAVAVPNN